jgi:hypothetical protein
MHTMWVRAVAQRAPCTLARMHVRATRTVISFQTIFVLTGPRPYDCNTYFRKLGNTPTCWLSLLGMYDTVLFDLRALQASRYAFRPC